MDMQMKRGLLDVCVLASIKNADSYGYNIIKEMQPFINISESTLYPILRRLKSAGMLTEYSIEHSGRLRKYYHITDDGRKRLGEFARDWEEMQKIFEFVTRGNNQ